jgi:hypothetical protein
MLDSPAQLVKACGGPTEVAKHFGLAVSTVGSWVSRDSIPDDFRPGMVELAARKNVAGIDYRWMTLVHAKPLASAGTPQPAGANQ